MSVTKPTMKSGAIMGIIALAGLLLAGCVSSGTPSPTPMPTISATPSPTASPTIAPTPTIADTKTGTDKVDDSIRAALPDGVYAGSQNYTSPGGNEVASFNLTIKDGVITAASFEGTSDNNISAFRMGEFAKAMPDLVVGKKVDALDLPKNIGGSSLTTGAFKAYLDSLLASNA